MAEQSSQEHHEQKIHNTEIAGALHIFPGLPFTSGDRMRSGCFLIMTGFFKKMKKIDFPLTRDKRKRLLSCLLHYAVRKITVHNKGATSPIIIFCASGPVCTGFDIIAERKFIPIISSSIRDEHHPW